MGVPCSVEPGGDLRGGQAQVAPGVAVAGILQERILIEEFPNIRGYLILGSL